MRSDVLEYCARAVIRYLDGNIELFDNYRYMAMRAYEHNKSIAKLGELIPQEVKQELKKMVS